MDDEVIKITLRILGIPLALVIAAVVLTLKKRSIRDYFALKAITRWEAFVWLMWYIPVFIVGEVWYFGLGLNEGRIWDYTLTVMVIRALGIIILAPVTEELIFRGVLFKAISDARPGPIGAVILTSVIFTASHYQYGILDLIPIFIGAFYWGWVRYKTGSTILPIVMHMFANGIAVVEFLWLNKVM